LHVNTQQASLESNKLCGGKKKYLLRLSSATTLLSSLWMSLQSWFSLLKTIIVVAEAAALTQNYRRAPNDVLEKTASAENNNKVNIQNTSFSVNNK